MPPGAASGWCSAQRAAASPWAALGEDVHSCAGQPAFGERGGQLGFINDSAACHVHEECARLHERDLRAPIRLRVERVSGTCTVTASAVASRSCSGHSGRHQRGRLLGHERAAASTSITAMRAIGDGHADLVQADDPEGLAAQLDACQSRRASICCAEPMIRRGTCRAKEQKRKGMLRCGDRVARGGVDDRDARLRGGRDVMSSTPTPGAADDSETCARGYRFGATWTWLRTKRASYSGRTRRNRGAPGRT